MFDATQYVNQEEMNSGATDRSPIPPGKYKAYLVKWERRASKSGNGSMLNCEFAVLVGSAKRKVWHNFNFDNKNPDAVRISYEQFAKFALSCGNGSLRDEWDPIELMQKLFEAVIEDEKGYTRIKYFNQAQPDSPVMASMAALTKPVAPAKVVEPAAVMDDDEIPF